MSWNKEKKRTIEGIKYTVFSRFGSQLIQFVYTLYLARALSPSDYGMIGMVYSFTGFAALLGDAGIQSAVIQKKEVTREDRDVVFTLQLVVYTVIAAGLLILSYPISIWLHEPKARAVIQVVSASFIIKAMTNVSNAMLTRDLRFKEIFTANVVSTLLGGGAAVWCASVGYGYWSLVIQNLVSISAGGIIMAVFLGGMPRLAWRRVLVMEILNYSAYLTIHQIVNYWSRYADNLFVGRNQGVYQLGQYARAYSFLMMTVKNVPDVLGRVLFPLFSRIRDDRRELFRLYIKTIRQVAYITYPMLSVMAVLAKELLAVLFGVQWIESSSSLTWLSFAGFIQMVVFPTAWLYMALGETKAQLKVTLWCSSIMIVLLILLSYVSIEAVSAGVLLNSIIAFYMHYGVLKGVADVGRNDVLRTLRNPILASCIMIGVLIAVKLVMSIWGMPDIVVLASGLILAIAVYVYALRRLDLTAFNEISALLRGSFQFRAK